MWGTCQQCREPEGILRITHSSTYKKGRRSLQQEEEYNTNQSLIQQILDHEARISAILKPPRRLKQKRSMEEANRADNIEADVETGSSIKVHAVGGHTVDLDISNCCLALVHQIIKRTNPDPSLPEDLLTLFDQIANRRSEFIASIGLEHSEGKDVINTVFNGGSPPSKLKDKEPIKNLQKIALYVRWACQTAIQNKTSFNVKIVAKKHSNFIQLIQSEGTLVQKHPNVPDLLLVQGNCIPCSVWHAMPTTEAAIIAALKQEGNRGIPADTTTRYRTYRAVATMAGLDMMASVGLPPEHIKNFLLRYEGNGVPHAVSVRFDTTAKIATVIDGARVYKIPIGSCQNAYLAAIDQSTIISYWKRDTRDKADAKAAAVLDMAAGASDGSEEDTIRGRDC
eukprot:s4971_g1.t1